MSEKMPPRRGYNYVPYAMIPTCAVHDTRVTPALLQVLACCGSYATQKSRRWLWGKPADIARDLGISRQAVHHHLGRLEEYGYVAIERGRHRADGGKDANAIRLLMDVIVPDQYLRDNQPRRRMGIGGAPRKVINIVDKYPPVNSELTPMQLHGVDTHATSGVDTPVNSMELHTLSTSKQHSGDTNPQEFRPESPAKRRKENKKIGSDQGDQEGRAERLVAPRDFDPPTVKKLSREEAERRREEAHRREEERLYGKRVAKGGAR